MAHRDPYTMTGMSHRQPLAQSERTLRHAKMGMPSRIHTTSAYQSIMGPKMADMGPFPGQSFKSKSHFGPFRPDVAKVRTSKIKPQPKMTAEMGLKEIFEGPRRPRGITAEEMKMGRLTKNMQSTIDVMHQRHVRTFNTYKDRAKRAANNRFGKFAAKTLSATMKGIGRHPFLAVGAASLGAITWGALRGTRGIAAYGINTPAGSMGSPAPVGFGPGHVSFGRSRVSSRRGMPGNHLSTDGLSLALHKGRHGM